jgi:hypothetical protein
VASSSRPYASQPGRPDATSTEQVGQAYPSHPTLLSVGGCKRGSTPLSSYITPSTMPREEGASSFSLTGGTAGWLLNLRPGIRGMVAYDGPAGRCLGRPGPRLSASHPHAWSLLYVANHLTSYTAVRLPASVSRWSTYPASMRPTEPAPRAGAQSQSWTTRVDVPLGTHPASLETRIDRRSSQPTRTRNPRHGRYQTYDPTYPLPTGHVACRGREGFIAYLGVMSAVPGRRTGGSQYGTSIPSKPFCWSHGPQQTTRDSDVTIHPHFHQAECLPLLRSQ